ncbi:RidA family protein [Parerythrobacter jejuensis]|uniref:RidA family protein n=1 Tax=Parerythrobacter jejuensis TaxID=795812 RepID=A0A845AWF6_9SPHN|nr:RidA family protein [Parerythrobacter jejuensis]MXP30743.1 RidA family protein [Parerythrobacter jejuensis]MXP33503.1 RidA family protein [Parerythrobacter jejuensis]
MSIEARLEELGIVLPEAAAPVASYVPVVVHGGFAHLSGQLPFIDGKLVKGRLGEDVSLEQGVAAARACGLMIIAQLKNALIPLDGVERVVKLGAFVNSTADFTDQPKVANGASELMFDVFGEKGRHARSAVGVPTLPLGVAVEIDAIVALAGE